MKIKIIEKKEETSGVTTFVFVPEPGFSWQAGQLLHYTLPHENPDDRGIERYFTNSAAPFEKNIHITTRYAGENSSSFKKALFSMNIGDSIEVDGLEGDFVLDDPNKEYVFIAGGIGITPFRSILADLDHQNKDVNITLLYGNRDDNFVFKDELEAFKSKHPGLKIFYFGGDNHIDEEAIRQRVPDLTKPIFYVSGPEPMVESFEKMLLNMGIPDEHLKRDFFPGYTEI